MLRAIVLPAQDRDELYQNRLNHEARKRGAVIADNRPLAVIIENTHDWNGGLLEDGIVYKITDTEQSDGITTSLIRQGYRVMYVEAPDFNLAKLEILDFTQFQPAELLVIGSHGSKNTLSEWVDFSSTDLDVLNKIREELRGRVKETIIKACSAGKDVGNVVDAWAYITDTPATGAREDEGALIFDKNKFGKDRIKYFVWDGKKNRPVDSYTADPRQVEIKARAMMAQKHNQAMNIKKIIKNLIKKAAKNLGIKFKVKVTTKSSIKSSKKKAPVKATVKPALNDPMPAATHVFVGVPVITITDITPEGMSEVVQTLNRSLAVPRNEEMEILPGKNAHERARSTYAQILLKYEDFLDIFSGDFLEDQKSRPGIFAYHSFVHDEAIKLLEKIIKKREKVRHLGINIKNFRNDLYDMINHMKFDPILPGKAFPISLKGKKPVRFILRDIFQDNLRVQLRRVNREIEMIWSIGDQQFGGILKEPIAHIGQAVVEVVGYGNDLHINNIGTSSFSIGFRPNNRAQINTRPGRMESTGGIDLTTTLMKETTKQDGQLPEGIRFNLDKAMMAQLHAAPGLVPEITSLVPLRDLKEFLETP